MASKQENEPRPAAEKAQETPTPSKEHEAATERAAEVSADAAQSLDDIDELIAIAEESIRATLCAPDEVVEPEELAKRIEAMVKGFEQRGGQ